MRERKDVRCRKGGERDRGGGMRYGELADCQERISQTCFDEMSAEGTEKLSDERTRSEGAEQGLQGKHISKDVSKEGNG